jgi:hypothetical protein
VPTIKPPQPLPTVEEPLPVPTIEPPRIRPMMEPSQTSYNRTYEFLQQCKDWRLSRPSTLGLLDCPEKPLSMKIDVEEWARLCSDFDLGETDDA